MNTTKIKNALGLAGAGTLAVGAALAGSTLLGVAPWAHADPNPFTGPSPFAGSMGDHDAYAFWTDAHNVGLAGPPEVAGLLGQSICISLGKGQTEAQAVKVGMDSAHASYGEAQAIVDAAEFHFCPERF